MFLQKIGLGCKTSPDPRTRASSNTLGITPQSIQRAIASFRKLEMSLAQYRQSRLFSQEFSNIVPALQSEVKAFKPTLEPDAPPIKVVTQADIADAEMLSPFAKRLVFSQSTEDDSDCNEYAC